MTETTVSGRVSAELAIWLTDFSKDRGLDRSNVIRALVESLRDGKITLNYVIEACGTVELARTPEETAKIDKEIKSARAYMETVQSFLGRGEMDLFHDGIETLEAMRNDLEAKGVDVGFIQDFIDRALKSVAKEKVELEAAFSK